MSWGKRKGCDEKEWLFYDCREHGFKKQKAGKVMAANGFWIEIDENEIHPSTSVPQKASQSDGPRDSGIRCTLFLLLLGDGLTLFWWGLLLLLMTIKGELDFKKNSKGTNRKSSMQSHVPITHSRAKWSAVNYNPTSVEPTIPLRCRPAAKPNCHNRGTAGVVWHFMFSLTQFAFAAVTCELQKSPWRPL